MRKLIPKAHLKWKEPKFIRNAKDEMDSRALSPWFKPGVVVLSAVLLMFNWWLAKQNPNKTPPSLTNALALALGGGIFFAYVVPWMYRLCPSYIQVFDHGIARSCGNSGAVWKYKDIDHCEITTVTLQRKDHSVLVIHTRKARRIILGVPPDLVPQLKEMLSQMNVNLMIGAQPTSAPYSEPARCAAQERVT